MSNDPPSKTIDRVLAIFFSQRPRMLSLCIRGIGISLLFLLLVGLSFTEKAIPTTYAASPSALNSSLYTDTVIVMDNVDQIRVHDPNGDRFTAAQLYVNLAPVGDRIGLVEITSSPSPQKILDLQDMNSQGKTLVNQKLGSFGPVDPNPTAYFTPALQAAGNILNQGNDRQNRKYVVIVTDAVALSGDQGPCTSSPDQFHNWFCAAGALEAQGITIILLGFSKPGDEAALIPTKNYIDANGGTVLPIADGADVAQRLAQTYTELLTRTHPNIFLAKFNGTPSALTIGAEDKLTDMTIVGLGTVGVSFADIQTPTNDHIAGKTSGDGIYTSTNGKGYSLESISGGNLVGTWHLQPGNTAPAQVLVIGISEGKFLLLNPAPAYPNSEVGIRYIAPQEPIVLRARVTKVDDTPPVGIGFIVNPGTSNAGKFADNTLPVTEIPDNQDADMTAVLQPSSASSITIGLGAVLASNTYFLKTFPISVRPELANKGLQLQIPASSLLHRGQGVSLSAQGTPSKQLQSLSIFAQDSGAPADWIPVATNSTGSISVNGSFVPPQGCGTQYTIVAIEDVSGTIGSGQYDYLTFEKMPYTSNIEQGTTGYATLLSPPYLEWIGSQATWKLQFSNTVCVPQTISLDVQLQGKNGFVPPSAGISNGSATFTLPANATSAEAVTATFGACPFNWLNDRTVELQLIAHSDVKTGNQFLQDGLGWKQTITCPSALTNAWRYWGAAILLLIILSIIGARFLQYSILPFVPPRHIIGEVKIDVDAPRLVAQKGGPSPVIPSNYIESLTLRVPSRLPVHNGLWYLERHTTGTEVIYSLEKRESALAMLAFSMKQDQGGYHVYVAATKYATGANLPEFQSGQPVNQEPVICDGEPIIVGNDLISPELNVSD